MLLHCITELARTVAEPKAEEIDEKRVMAYKERVVHNARKTGRRCRSQTVDEDEGVPFAREIMIPHVRAALLYEERFHPFLL
jgi:hypothetical protein